MLHSRYIPLTHRVPQTQSGFARALRKNKHHSNRRKLFDPKWSVAVSSPFATGLIAGASRARGLALRDHRLSRARILHLYPFLRFSATQPTLVW
jgi:hypothetical protein